MQNECNRPGSDPHFSLAARLACKHKPDLRGCRLREGFDCRKTITFLKIAGSWLVSANKYHEPFEALVGAAYIYTAVLDATATATGTWWPVHTVAYSVLTGVLEEGFGLRLHLEDEAKPRLYDVASATAERLDPDDEVSKKSEATEPLQELMDEYRECLEWC